VLNAVLYATSANLEGEAQKASSPSTQTDIPQDSIGSYSSEEVYILPGHIDIRRLRQLQAVERAPSGSLMHRFLVRGHWRRPNPKWKDQRIRWIQPYWKGPDMAALVERAYRLRSPQEIPTPNEDTS